MYFGSIMVKKAEKNAKKRPIKDIKKDIKKAVEEDDFLEMIEKEIDGQGSIYISKDYIGYGAIVIVLDGGQK